MGQTDEGAEEDSRLRLRRPRFDVDPSLQCARRAARAQLQTKRLNRHAARAATFNLGRLVDTQLEARHMQWLLSRVLS